MKFPLQRSNSTAPKHAANDRARAPSIHTPMNPWVAPRSLPRVVLIFVPVPRPDSAQSRTPPTAA